MTSQTASVALQQQQSGALAELSQETLALTRRLFLQLMRRPSTLIAGVLQPLIWLILFGALFANAPEGLLPGGMSYGRFLGAGVIVFTAFSGALNAGLPVMFDREFGFLNRLLVAPLRSRSSIVLASVIYITALSLLQSLAIMGTAAVLGYGWPGISGLAIGAGDTAASGFCCDGPQPRTGLRFARAHRVDRCDFCGQLAVAVCQHGLGSVVVYADLAGLACGLESPYLRDRTHSSGLPGSSGPFGRSAGGPLWGSHRYQLPADPSAPHYRAVSCDSPSAQPQTFLNPCFLLPSSSRHLDRTLWPFRSRRPEPQVMKPCWLG